MGRAEAGTPKAIANAMKSKGLQKLRWYCQVCQKQCRDENAFKQHSMSEGHLRAIKVVGENAGKHISDYSAQFQAEFVSILSRRWGTKRVSINRVYQDYIQDKHHIHMNATRWVSLTAFAMHLGKSGICHVEETDQGWFVSWIDTSPRALMKADASSKRERSDFDEEMRTRKLINEQIERAREQEAARRRERDGVSTNDSSAAAEETAPAASTSASDDKTLKRDEGEKVSLNLSLKKPDAGETDAPKPALGFKMGGASSTSSSSASALKPNPLKPNPLKPNPLKANPLKPNPLKAASGSAGGSMNGGATKRSAPLSMAEQIAMEEMAKKTRRS